MTHRGGCTDSGLWWCIGYCYLTRVVRMFDAILHLMSRTIADHVETDKAYNSIHMEQG
jgi:hypothetical protein